MNSNDADRGIRPGDPPVTSRSSAYSEGEPPSQPTTSATVTLHVQATGNGRIVGWAEMKEGRLVDASWFGRITTTLTNVITDVCELAEALDPDYRIVMLIPNGLTGTSLDMKLVGQGFEVICARRLVRGWFPFNPIAAEFGSNYDVIVTIAGDSVRAKSAFEEMLRTKYPCLE